jgi:hypothetical protein
MKSGDGCLRRREREGRMRKPVSLFIRVRDDCAVRDLAAKDVVQSAKMGVIHGMDDGAGRKTREEAVEG